MRDPDREYQRLLRLRDPDRVEATRMRWRRKKLDEGLCTNCGNEPWLSENGYDRTICWTCLSAKEFARIEQHAASLGLPPEDTEPKQLLRTL
jgi:hypothetical protein